MVNNYYELFVKVGRNKYTINSNQEIDTNYLEKYVKIVNISDDLEETTSNKITIFNDNTFNGERKEIKIAIKDFISKSEIEDDYELKFIKLHLCKITKDIYQYKKSIKLYNDNIDDFFSQPIQVYSNIQNGYGIFGGSIAKSHRIF